MHKCSGGSSGFGYRKAFRKEGGLVRIRRMWIGDFGILREQLVDKINDGVVVIGGLNRAGKSTFMQLLKHIGYGFPQGGHLPPANSRYFVEFDAALDSGQVCN